MRENPDSPPPAASVTVDVWSDVACPWCYIGKRRFEEGVRQYEQSGGAAAVEVRYHSFELAPETPVDFDGSELDFLERFKGLPRHRVHQLVEQVTAIAATVGLPYDFATLKHTNTRKAHEVLQLAAVEGVQATVKERLFSAYFVEGRHLGRDGELADLAGEAGLDPAAVRTALADGTYRAAVDADVTRAAELGIEGVPFYVLQGRYAISGAREPELFAVSLAEAASS